MPLLSDYFGWNLAGTQCLSGPIIAWIKVRTVNFAQSATALPDGALKDSKYKRIQRLFRTFPLDFSTVARFIVSQVPHGQYLLTMDRTNWKCGQTNINILCLAIVHQGVAIPVLSILLDKKGNSNTDERIQLINRFIELFGVEKIDGYARRRNSMAPARNLFRNLPRGEILEFFQTTSYLLYRSMILVEIRCSVMRI